MKTKRINGRTHKHRKERNIPNLHHLSRLWNNCQSSDIAWWWANFIGRIFFLPSDTLTDCELHVKGKTRTSFETNIWNIFFLLSYKTFKKSQLFTFCFNMVTFYSAPPLLKSPKISLIWKLLFNCPKRSWKCINFS